jgi:hypothetical protein
MKANIFAALLVITLTNECILSTDCYSYQTCIAGYCIDSYTNSYGCSFSSDCSSGYYCSYGYCTKSSTSSFGIGLSTWYFCVAGIPSIIGISLVLTIVLCVRRCALRARMLRNGGMHMATPNIMAGVTITQPQMAFARPQIQSPNIVYQQPQANVGYAQPMMMQQNQPMMVQQNQPQMMMQQNQPQMMMGQPVMQQNMGYMQPQMQVQGNIQYGQPQMYNAAAKL